MTRRSGVKEWGFDIDVENARVEDFQKVIHSQRWQLFCKHPNAAAMMVVREFFANASEGTSSHTMFVKGKQVKYDAATINHLIRLQYNPTDPDEVEYLLNDANMAEVARVICQCKGTKWTIVRDERAHIPFEDLQQHMKVWHHFICARLTPTMNLLEVTKEWAVLLYGIQKRLKINVGRCIQPNISHTIRQGSGGIPHPPLLTELIASYRIDTMGSDLL